MNVLLVNTFVAAGAGGQERAALDLALGLHEAGHHVVILGPYSNSSALRQRIPPEIELSEDPWRNLPPGRRESHLQLFRTALRLIRSYSIDIVSGHGRMFGVYGACRIAGIPLVWTVHGVDMSPYEGRVTLKARAIRATLRSMAKDRRVCFVAVSEFTSRTFLPMFQPARPPQLVTILPRIASLPALLAVPAPDYRGPLQIGSVGRLEEIKGIFDLPAIALRLRQRGVAFTLLIYGDGVMEQKLREAFAQEGFEDTAVRFMGYESDVTKIYSSFHVMLHLSRKDWLPLTVVESTAAGRPVIAYNAGGVPEIVEDGQTGILCRPGVTEEIVDRLEEVCKNRDFLASLAAQGRASIASRFTVERMVEEYVELFSRLLLRQRCRRRMLNRKARTC
jgi:glycosyltransferase involved in cell wall biosynthesis